ncbi:serine/threonine-protein phosphatase 6 regulatory ankyrin repeat subunit B-like [Thraustotheca clavata]|uniref:Serine/threonine-protein phosphatase 6 regulatory ankyrin repeat subunit B-like n=1 Tax=Thraustotheca clavata TaxID=74557 RepID=A0A1V9ZVJ3_9STRA|nr:serine/threonine-protein phosphatase 6 regulatory ankyrin repeat subunit B-like [Thraustotheca clavata]
MAVLETDEEVNATSYQTLVHSRHSFPHLENPTEKMHFMARRIQLWYFVFKPKNQTDTDDDAFALFRRLYSSKLGSVEKATTSVLQKWFRIYLISKRSAYEEFEDSPGDTSFRDEIVEIPGSQEASWIVASIEVVYSIVKPLVHDLPEEYILEYLNQLPTACIVVNSADDNDIVLTDDIVQPKDTLFHILVQTCANVSEKCLQLFYRQGIPIHQTGAYNRTILHAAAEGGHVNTLKTLLAHGADIHAVDEFGAKPLHVAARNGHLAAVQFFVEDANIPVDSTSTCGKTALHYAAKYNKIDLAKYLVSKGSDINASDDQQYSPLHFAVANGHLDIVKFLIDNEAGVIVNASGCNFIHEAAKHNRTHIMEYLSTYPHLETHSLVKDHNCFTPLHLAAANGSISVYTFLNGNPWRGKHPGLIQDNEGLFPLNLLLRSEAASLEKEFKLYLPRNAESDDIPIWHDELFTLVLRDAPQFAWIYIDAYRERITRFGGTTTCVYPKLDEMYGAPSKFVFMYMTKKREV